MQANYSTDQKKFTDHMFNIKLEAKSHEISFNALLVKIKESKIRQGRRNVPPPPLGQLVFTFFDLHVSCFTFIMLQFLHKII